MPRNTILFSAENVDFGVSECGDEPRNAGDTEVEPHTTLVFPLRGVFGLETESRRVTASPATMLLFEEGQPHRISHPTGGHDRSAFFALRESLDWADRCPIRLVLPTSPSLDLGLRQVLAGATAGHLSELEIEEFVVAASSHAIDSPGSEGAVSHSRTRLVADAEEYLAASFRENCDLMGIARAVGSSPHHLSRVFKEVTGETIARRRMRLRMTFVLDQISEGLDDLSSLAVDAGFYDHAHMANTFKNNLGVTPSHTRNSLLSGSPGR